MLAAIFYTQDYSKLADINCIKLFSHPEQQEGDKGKTGEDCRRIRRPRTNKRCDWQ